MSPFWVEPQRLLIDTDAICLGNNGAARRVEFNGMPEAGLAALTGESAGMIRRGARWHVLLADALVRYLVIHWPAGLRGRAEREAFVAHRFREVHGVVAPEWQIAIECSAADLPVLACAAPAVLVDAVGAWAQRNRQRVVGITGEFIGAYNRARSRLAYPLGALALQRGGRVTVGLWRDAAWQALRSQPLDPAGDAALGLFLESTRVWSGATEEGGVLYCLGAPFDTPVGWRTVTLEDQEIGRAHV